MIKATATRFGADGTRKLLIIGLSYANLDKLRADGMDGFIRINGEEMGLPVDVLITAGETEAIMSEKLLGCSGPETKIHISDKLKQ